MRVKEEFYVSLEKLKALVNEVRKLAEFHSINVPMIYGDGTETSEKAVTIVELDQILDIVFNEHETRMTIEEAENKIRMAFSDYFPFNGDKEADEVIRVLEDAFSRQAALSKDNKCRWIHYDYRTICPKEHDVENPYWRIPENRMEVLKFCPYCGKEIVLEGGNK